MPFSKNRDLPLGEHEFEKSYHLIRQELGGNRAAMQARKLFCTDREVLLNLHDIRSIAITSSVITAAFMR